MSTKYEPVPGLITTGKFLSLLESSKFEIMTNSKKEKFYNIPAAFDIETTSFYLADQKYAIMYEWTFGIGNWITYGRTWEQFQEMLMAVSVSLSTMENHLVVYVHNLAYEWQFMHKRFKWYKVFFLDARKPVYAINEYGIEFRCSLKLSGKSLANTAEDIKKYPVKKLVGDLDYSVMRHSLTKLTEKELAYCEHDVRVVLSYIQEKIEQDGGIIYIPLTNTGYVRNKCRKACFERWREYHDFISKLTLEPDEYEELKEAFQGGFTHANAQKVDKTWSNVASYDFTSSYPAVMLSEMFPMEKGQYVGSCSVDQIHILSKKYCCMFRCKIHFLISTTEVEHPLSASKCRKLKSGIEDNGRLVTAEYLETTLTEQDLFIMENFYDWDSFEIFDLIIYRKAYLPKEFIKVIIELYKDKTKLKDIQGEEINYMIAKNMLNALYGMTVTDIVRDAYEYDEYFGCTKLFKDATKEEKRNNLEEQIEKYNKNIRRFLFYPWGVWVTAYARYNLFTGIYAVGDDYIYSDTDSIKFTNPEKHKEYFDNYNTAIKEKLRKMAVAKSIPFENFSPVNKYGKSKPIGVWDYEGVYTRFKTLGAKRYMVEENGVYKVTVAGVNKKTTSAMFNRIKDGDPFDFFNTDLIVPSTDSGRNILTYIDEEQRGVLVDLNGVACEFFEYSSIHMEPTSYSMHRSDAFRDYLMQIWVKEESW